MGNGVVCVLVVMLGGVGFGFFLPGLTPVDYEYGASLDIMAYQLTSNRNKVPYDYYSLPVCPISERKRKGSAWSRRRGSVAHSTGVLGAAMVGERPRLTSYEVRMRMREPCRVVCTREIGREEMVTLVRRIRQKYRVKLAVDDLPVVELIGVRKSGKGVSEKVVEIGYPVGFVKGSEVYLNNHLRLNILYNKPTFSVTEDILSSSPGEEFRIVGFEVKPESVKFPAGGETGPVESCTPLTGNESQLLLPDPKSMKDEKPFSVAFTYEVEFVESSDLQWATRWDPLLVASSGRKEIQWFALGNAILLGIFMTGLIALILVRTLYKDFAKYYGDLELADEDGVENSGWKVLRGDVFRAPPGPTFLAVMAATGAQISVISLVSLACALFGMMSPAYRGGIITAMLISWVMTSSISGYIATRLYRTFGGTSWKKVTMVTALLFPAVCFAIFFSLNLILWGMGSTGAAPVVTVIVLLILWLGISVPLSFAGGFLGQSRKIYHFPVRTNTIPRQIPLQPFYVGLPIYLAGGALPFCVVSMELLYILNSIWLNEYYYMFGLLTLVASLLVVIAAETNIVIVYVKLLNEDYRWWWQAYGTSFMSGAYVLLYSIFYIITAEDLNDGNFASWIIYLSYMSLLSLMFFLAVGSIGFFAAFWFVRKIFTAIRVD